MALSAEPPPRGADERGSIISLTDSAGALMAINRYDGALRLSIEGTIVGTVEAAGVAAAQWENSQQQREDRGSERSFRLIRVAGGGFTFQHYKTGVPGSVTLPG